MSPKCNRKNAKKIEMDVGRVIEGCKDCQGNLKTQPSWWAPKWYVHNIYMIRIWSIQTPQINQYKMCEVWVNPSYRQSLCVMWWCEVHDVMWYDVCDAMQWKCHIAWVLYSGLCSTVGSDPTALKHPLPTHPSTQYCKPNCYNSKNGPLPLPIWKIWAQWDELRWCTYWSGVMNQQK